MVQHDAVSLDDALVSVSVVRENLLRHKLSALPPGRKFQDPPGKKFEKPALKRRKMEGDGKVKCALRGRSRVNAVLAKIVNCPMMGIVRSD